MRFPLILWSARRKLCEYAAVASISIASVDAAIVVKVFMAGTFRQSRIESGENLRGPATVYQSITAMESNARRRAAAVRTTYVHKRLRGWRNEHSPRGAQ